jgi:localization factor PodJL
MHDAVAEETGSGMSSRGPNGNAEATIGTARPAGMPLGQWLNAKLAQPAPPPPAPPAPPSYALPPQPHMPQPQFHMQQPAPMASAAADSLSEIHQRLDGITRQIDQMSQRRAATTGAPSASGLANQLNDAISRLDMRLNNLAQSPPPRAQVPNPVQGYPVQSHPAQSHSAQSHPTHSAPLQSPPLPHHPTPSYDIERAAAEIRQSAAYHASPPLSPTGMDAAIAEITARRHALNNGGAHMPAPNPFMQYAPAPPLAPAPTQPAPVAPPPPPIDLSGIERQLHNLTSQMEALRRPDHLDQSITAFREELAEIRRSLTEALPRQAIDSLENEIRALGQKIEQSRQSGGDQETLGGIERALNEIYGAVRSLTPAEQLTGYDTAIQNLSSKIDLLVRANPDSNIVQQLEDAIGALRNIAANVASNDAIVHMGEHIRALGEKLDHLSQAGGNDMLAALEQRIALLTAAMEGRPVQAAAADSSHLEDAIRALSERIDRLSVGNDSSGAMAHVEQRIAYLLERLEGSQSSPQGLGRIEGALSDILRHLENERVNFMSAQAAAPVADTSGLVDTIRREISDVRHSQSATERRTQDTLEALHSTLSHVVDRLTMIDGDLRRVQQSSEPQAAYAPPQAPAPYAPPQTIRPELQNPAAPQMSDIRFGAAPATPAPTFREPEAQPVPMWQQPAQRAPIDPNLPPDFPLEPGARNRGPEAVAADAGAGQAPTEGNGQSNFIAAARRAAQAASAATSEKPGRVTALTEAARSAAAKATAKVTSAAGEAPAKPSRIRSILVGFGVVVVVLGAFKIALTILESYDSAPAQTTTDKSVAPSSLAPPPPPPAPAPASMPKAEAPMPLLISPTAVERQSFVAPTPAMPAPETPAATRVADVTGTVVEPAALAAPAAPPAVASLSPVSDKIPDGVAGPMLRDAALRGDPAAAYEVAARYAEGRGTQVNYEEAIKWYGRAADKGIVLAMFRLGTLLEKGLGTQKDPDAARRYYVQAAERGNAKAMHNLAVLDADGGGRGPNYKAAGNWFKKAAERGIADSQYNLGILYARGIGLEQNLAESYKWFSLAASQGDADAGRKRDDIAKKLDQQSLAAAKLAIQTFTPERQPNDAIAVAAPAGGWDAAPTATTKRPAKAQGKTTASR